MEGEARGQSRRIIDCRCGQEQAHPTEQTRIYWGHGEEGRRRSCRFRRGGGIPRWQNSGRRGDDAAIVVVSRGSLPLSFRRRYRHDDGGRECLAGRWRLAPIPSTAILHAAGHGRNEQQHGRRAEWHGRRQILRTRRGQCQRIFDARCQALEVHHGDAGDGGHGVGAFAVVRIGVDRRRGFGGGEGYRGGFSGQAGEENGTEGRGGRWR
mmetsp:Transcript_18725/g.39237  ORF Transcript_18725/g.39237 Transcript_18725/m.39237 type:complete len:209 (-) Transcript_18725:98-724(-)